jgi:SAM-dependent methyltransferase
VKTIRKLLKRTPVHTAYKAWQALRARRVAARHELRGPGPFVCNACGRSWDSFRPLEPGVIADLKAAGWPYEPTDAETLNPTHYSCWGCGAADRDRLYLLYLEQMIAGGQVSSVVEFAPSPAIGRCLAAHPEIHHRTADLFMPGVDDRVDLQDLSIYADGQFDFIVCSHVLEHVGDDVQALRELHRILRVGGKGIVMVPIILGVQATDEDPTATDRLERMRRFGQDDHVRLYAKADFLRRLEGVGFTVELLGQDHFGAEAFELHGISPGSMLYVVERRSLAPSDRAAIRTGSAQA